MAQLEKGILGPFSGKVGTLNGSSLRGEQIIRSLSLRSGKPSTVLQMEHWVKFKTVFEFLKPLTPLVAVTFRKRSVDKTPHNAAMQYNYRNALTDAHPDYSIDFTSVDCCRYFRWIADIHMDRQFRHRQCIAKCGYGQPASARLPGKNGHTWLSFISANDKLVATSI